jgi:hypothetical protein
MEGVLRGWSGRKPPMTGRMRPEWFKKASSQGMCRVCAGYVQGMCREHPENTQGTLGLGVMGYVMGYVLN